MLKVAIIGCGSVGIKRAEALQRLSTRDQKTGKCELVLSCDIDCSKAKLLADRYGGDITPSWEDAVNNEKIDLVVVATTNKYLAPITIQALCHRKHVLCEKPLGRNVREAKEILSVAGTNGVVLKTGFNHRHYPAIAKAKAIVEQGHIGPLYLARCRYGHGGRPGYELEWRANKELAGGGELLDQGVHIVDLFRWFLGDFEEAFGYAVTYFWNMPVEDNVFALFRTKRDQVAMMHTSWTQWKNIFSFEVFGEKGYLIVEGRGGSYGPASLKIGRRKVCVNKGVSQDMAPSRSHVTPLTHSRISYKGGAPGEETIVFDNCDSSWDSEWVEFISAIEENREPLGNGRDGLEANRMIEAIYTSARENRPVKIREICSLPPN